MSLRFSWDLIASARAVLETGSLSAAAKSLGVTQPTIRRHIDDLEAALGVALFTRSPTGLIPTDAARDIAPYAQDIHGLVSALVRGASADRDGVNGTIRVSCSEIMGNEVLPFLLAPFLANHPDLAIELVASNRTENLLRRDSDMAIRMVRPVQQGLVARKIAEVPLGLFAAQAYIERRGAPTDIADLMANHAMVGEDSGGTIVKALTAISPAAASIDFRYRTDSDSAQLSAIRAGIGIGICQTPLGLADAGLRPILPNIQTPLEVWLVIHENSRGQRRIQALMAHLAKAIPLYSKGTDFRTAGFVALEPLVLERTRCPPASPP